MSKRKRIRVDAANGFSQTVKPPVPMFKAAIYLGALSSALKRPVCLELKDPKRGVYVASVTVSDPVRIKQLQSLVATWDNPYGGPTDANG